MSNIEGLYTFQSSSHEEPDVLRWGGVVTLESGRVLGGDSVMAYVGSYEVSNGQVSALVRSWSWNEDVGEITNVFGMAGKIDYMVTLEGRRNGDLIEGHLAPEAMPEFKLKIRMQKIAELP